MEDKVDPSPWSFKLNEEEIRKIWDFSHKAFLEKASPYKTKPEHFYLMCMLEGYHRFLNSKETKND